MLILTQKSYFCDNDTIYDFIKQEPVRKWRHNHRHKISRDSFADLSLFKTYSIIFIFRQIDRAIFAVRGSSSLQTDVQTDKGGLWNFGSGELKMFKLNVLSSLYSNNEYCLLWKIPFLLHKVRSFKYIYLYSTILYLKSAFHNTLNRLHVSVH